MLKMFPAKRLVRSCINVTSSANLQRRASLSVVNRPAEGQRIADFQEIPEPPSLPIFGTAFEYSRLNNFDASYFGEHWAKRHEKLGPIYKENILPGVTEYIVYSSSPEDTEAMFRSEGSCPYRDPLGPLAEVRSQLGHHCGLTNTNGKEWQRIRQIVNQHLLKTEVIWEFTQRHYEVALDFMKYIEKNLDSNKEVPNFDSALNRWACEGTGVFALDTRLGAFNDEPEPDLEKMISCNKTMFECMGRLLYGLPKWKYFDTQDMKSLRTAHHGQIEAAKCHMMRVLKNLELKKGKYTNLESILHTSTLTKSEKLMLMTEFLIAGIDTTSNCAAFLLYALAKNPDKQEKLRNEITSVVKSKGVNGKSLNQMPYLHACIKEPQRIFPFVSSMSRRYRKDITLSGYRIPAGTHVLNTSNMVNSRNPKYFDDCNSFVPERWNKLKTADERKRKRFVMSGPFGLGPRMCPGRKFAMQELQLLAVTLLTKYRVEYHHKPMKVKFRLVSFPSESPQFKFVAL